MLSSDAGVTNGTGALESCNFESSECNITDGSAMLDQVEEDDDDTVNNLSFNHGDDDDDDGDEIDYVENDISVRDSGRKLVDKEEQDAEYTYYEEEYSCSEAEEGEIEEQEDVTDV